MLATAKRRRKRWAHVVVLMEVPKQEMDVDSRPLSPMAGRGWGGKRRRASISAWTRVQANRGHNFRHRPTRLSWTPFYPPSSFSCSLFLTLVLAIPSDVPSQVTQTRLTTPSSISAWHTYYLALSRNMCQLAHTGAAECKSPLTSVLLLVVHEALYTKRNSALCFGTADEETECCDTQLCNPVK